MKKCTHFWLMWKFFNACNPFFFFFFLFAYTSCVMCVSAFFFSSSSFAFPCENIRTKSFVGNREREKEPLLKLSHSAHDQILWNVCCMRHIQLCFYPYFFSNQEKRKKKKKKKSDNFFPIAKKILLTLILN